MFVGGSRDLTYVGTDGLLCKGKDAEKTPPHHRPLEGPVDIAGYKGQGGFFGDFLHCVRTRETPFRDIESAHRAATVCHLGNIATWLNRSVTWNPETETIAGDPEAARWLGRPRRSPWAL